MNNKPLNYLVPIIVIFSLIATLTGITSNEGPGSYPYQSIRGKAISIYGKGIYKDMSAEVAPQGIAQDYVTLFFAIPLLLYSLSLTKKGSSKGKILLTGTLGYFLVTYLFYTVMGMYNPLFLLYVALMAVAFFGFLTSLLNSATSYNLWSFKKRTAYRRTGAYLIFTSITIGLLWLSIVVPPLLDGSMIPVQVEHYTTLIVQGLDLGILLPAAFICGRLWMKQAPLGILLAPVYFVFLSIMMTALTAKVIAMYLLGYPVMPVIFIIPIFNLLTLACTASIIHQTTERSAINKDPKYSKAIPS